MNKEVMTSYLVLIFVLLSTIAMAYLITPNDNKDNK
jgi:CHASE1-domain containing sensor protein